MLAALPMGANRDWAWAPIAVALGLLAVLVAAGFGAGRGFEVGERERWPLLVLIACFGLFVAFVLLQGSSIAPASGSTWLYVAALRILGSAHAAVPDIAIDAARNGLMKCITCGLIFVMARAICRDRDHARDAAGAAGRQRRPGRDLCPDHAGDDALLLRRQLPQEAGRATIRAGNA